MGLITGGLINNCLDGTCPGGAGVLYLANGNQYVGVTTSANNKVSAINLTTSANRFYAYQFRQDSASFTETLTVDPVTNALSVVQTFTGIVTCRTQELRDNIQTLAGQACGTVAVHGENTGNYWIWGNVNVGGLVRTAKLTTNEGVTGTAFTDPNQETITLTVTTSQKATALTSSAVVVSLT
jgi:hypothetical protein